MSLSIDNRVGYTHTGFSPLGVRRTYNNFQQRQSQVTGTESSREGRGFSIFRALGNFVKGLVSPITTMFSSLPNFLIGAGMIIGGIALTIATGGAATPLLIALGLGFGGFQLGSGIYKLAIARTAEEAENAFFDFGAGTSAIGLSVLGARAALKPIGVNTVGMSRLGATAECVRAIPTSLRLSRQAFTGGQWRANFSGFARNILPGRSNSTSLPDEVLGTSYSRARERYDLRVIVDESLPNSGRAVVVVKPNGSRVARIRINNNTREALSTPNHPEHARALRTFHEEVAHTHQTPVRPIRADGTRMSVREYTARRAFQELSARSVANAKTGGPGLGVALSDIHSLIRQGKFTEALRVARRNGVSRSYIQDFIRDYRLNLRANGRGLVQRSNSADDIRSGIAEAESVDDIQIYRQCARESGVNENLVNELARDRILQWIDEADFYNFDRVRTAASLADEVGISSEVFTQRINARTLDLVRRNGGRLSPDQQKLINQLGLSEEARNIIATVREATPESVAAPGPVISSRTMSLLDRARQSPKTVTPATLDALMEGFGFSGRSAKGNHSTVYSRGDVRVGANTHNGGSSYVHEAGVKDCLSAIDDVIAEPGI